MSDPYLEAAAKSLALRYGNVLWDSLSDLERNQWVSRAVPIVEAWIGDRRLWKECPTCDSTGSVIIPNTMLNTWPDYERCTASGCRGGMILVEVSTDE